MYAKIFDTVFDSSLFEEPPMVRLVFFCMLVACRNIDGIVFGTVKALARRFNLKEEDFIVSLNRLKQPDPNSTSKEYDGARIIEVAPNTWKIVNYQRYALLRDPEVERMKVQHRVATHRAKKRAQTGDTNSDPALPSVTPRYTALHPVTPRYTPLQDVTEDPPADSAITHAANDLADFDAAAGSPADDAGSMDPNTEAPPSITNTLDTENYSCPTEKKRVSSDTASRSSKSDTSLPREKKDISAEPKRKTASDDDDDEPVLMYPTVGVEREWVLSQSFLKKLNGLYPALDVLTEAKKALAWLIANPSRRKTARGMPRFLVNWLNRANDKGASPKKPQSILTPVYEDPEEGFRRAYEKAFGGEE